MASYEIAISVESYARKRRVNGVFVTDTQYRLKYDPVNMILPWDQTMTWSCTGGKLEIRFQRSHHPFHCKRKFPWKVANGTSWSPGSCANTWQEDYAYTITIIPDRAFGLDPITIDPNVVVIDPGDPGF